jgi:hypothetical protein
MATNKNEGLRIDTLERQVRELRKLVAETKQGNYIVVLVRSLGAEPVQLKSEIAVVVQPTGDDFIATYFDAGISMSGDSQEEAVDNLKALIVDLFESYEEDEAKLGPGPRQQLAALREVIERRP